MQVIRNLKRLEEDGIVIYKPTNSDAEITFLVPREDDRTINRFSKEIVQYINQKKKKAADFISFIKNDSVCRSVQVLNYFDEKTTEKCGICDVCLSNKKRSKTVTSSTIIKLLSTNKSYTSQEISTVLETNEQDILIHLRYLLSENKILINHQNKFQLNK